MAATYSSFMTTRFYSPVFNTALFDGPLRIYFSQSYESVALKIYQMLQTEYSETWNILKTHAQQSKQHLFLMVYPEDRDLKLVFGKTEHTIISQEWEEGLAIGFIQPQNDEDLKSILKFIEATIAKWAKEQILINEISH